MYLIKLTHQFTHADGDDQYDCYGDAISTVSNEVCEMHIVPLYYLVYSLGSTNKRACK